MVNEAYNNLQTPLKRAVHLLKLKGESIEENQTVEEPEFLIQMMSLNEEVGVSPVSRFSSMLPLGDYIIIFSIHCALSGIITKLSIEELPPCQQLVCLVACFCSRPGYLQNDC